MKPKNYWTKEKIKIEALKYKTKMEWKKNSSTSYQKALKINIFNDCIQHMDEILKPKNYWTVDRLKTEALKYAMHVGNFQTQPHNLFSQTCRLSLRATLSQGVAKFSLINLGSVA